MYDAADATDAAHIHGRHLHIAGVFIGFVTGLPRLFFPLAAVIFGAKNSDRAEMLIPAIVAAMLIISILFRWISWKRFRYFTGPDDIRIESGFINRSIRIIPYGRIQDVSIEQKPIARLFGLGEVRFETGGGKGDEGTLSFVHITEAQRLRELVKGSKSDLGGSDVIVQTGDTDTEPLFGMDGKRLLTFGFYSFSLIIFAVLGGLAQQFDFLLPNDFWDINTWFGVAKNNTATWDGIGWSARITAALFAVLGLILVGIITGIARTVIRDYGFRLEHTENGFRRRRGLFTLTDVLMPVTRIQAATIGTGPVRKLRGWHTLKFISLADDSGVKGEDGNDHVAAPFATMPEITEILAAAGINRPNADIPFIQAKAAYWVDRWLIFMSVLSVCIYALMALTDAGFYALWVLAVAPVYAVILYTGWRGSCYAVDTDDVFVRAGWWDQKLTILPQVKIQSADITQSPLGRLRGLATLNLGIAGGVLHIDALPYADAQALRHVIMNKAAQVDYSDIAAQTHNNSKIID
jgi:putative membrane protein